YCGGSDKSQSHHHLTTSSALQPIQQSLRWLADNICKQWIATRHKGTTPNFSSGILPYMLAAGPYIRQMVHILCKHLLCTWPQMYILIQSCEPLNCQMQLSQILYYCCSRMIHFASIHAPKILSHTRRTFWMHSYHPTSSKSTWDWANNLAKQKYAAAICYILRGEIINIL